MPVVTEVWIHTRPAILDTTFYAEFNSSGKSMYHLSLSIWISNKWTGPGANNSARIPQDHILTASEALNFTIDKVFLESPKWIDFEYSFWIDICRNSNYLFIYFVIQFIVCWGSCPWVCASTMLFYSTLSTAAASCGARGTSPRGVVGVTGVRKYQLWLLV